MRTKLLFTFLILLVLLTGCTGTEENEKIKITLGQQLTLSPILSFIAEKNAYFEEEGLDLEIIDYPSGKVAFEGLRNGNLNIFNSQEVPAVFNSFTRNDFKVAATINIARSDKVIVARRNAGIDLASDLQGKRIATQIGSAVHFYLYLFMIKNGISSANISFLPADKLVESLASGKIDAFSMREPYVSQARQALGEENIVTFPDNGIYTAFDLIIVDSKLIDENPKAIQKFIRALLKAEDFVKKHPEEAKNIVMNRVGVSKEEIDAEWGKYNPSVGLPQSLLLAMEDEARWAVANKLVDGDRIPNYLDYFYFDALDAEKPDSVTVIR